MSGHSKWHTIKHKKGAADAKRGKLFTRLIKELTVAARGGGGDPDMNPRLRTIIADAKAANMPAENIKRAIRRGTGEEPGVSYEEASYEGYGPGGAAVIIDVLTDNKNRTAGEIGHMVLEVGGPKCGCGNKGCFEALASRTAIFRKIKEAVKEGQKTILTEMLGPDLEDLRSGDLRKAIKRGDKFVEHIIEEAAEYTGIAVANLINLFNPEVVVIGGGLMEQLEDEMLAIIIETALDYAMPGTAKGIDIIATRLGDDAGITGAAVLARKHPS